MKTVVTGATGFIGSFLCEHLVGKGHKVSAVVRASSNLRWLDGPGILPVHADVCEPDSLRDVMDGADVVYHAAGLVRADRRADFMKVNFEGTRNVAQACLAASKPPGRLVFVSSQAAAGPSPDRQGIDERHPPRPVSAYGVSKLAAERYLAGLAGIEIVIVRPSAVFGPRDGETLSLFQIAARLRISPLLGAGKALISTIEVTDLVKGIALAGEVPQARGKTYFLAWPRPYSTEYLAAQVASAVGKRTVGVPARQPLLSAAAELSQFFSHVRGKTGTLSHLKVRELACRHWVVRIDAAQEELNFQPRIPIAEGIKAAARWYRDQRWL